MKRANIQQLLGELGGGEFEQKVDASLGEVAAAVVIHEKVGQVQITLDMKPIKNSGQVMMTYTVKYKMPTQNGSMVEDNASSCPMHVGQGGSITIFPDNQKDLFTESK